MRGRFKSVVAAVFHGYFLNVFLMMYVFMFSYVNIAFLSKINFPTQKYMTGMHK